MPRTKKTTPTKSASRKQTAEKAPETISRKPFGDENDARRNPPVARVSNLKGHMPIEDTRALESGDPGSIDEETLAPEAPYNRTYGRMRPR